MGSDRQEIWGRWAAAADRSDRDERIDKVATDYSNQPRDATRVPVAHRIQLKFDRFTGFINEYLSNLSPGGIFIRTDSPEPPGQLLDFEFRLGDGYELIRGRGEVVWARERAEGPERPPGMGVRFIELSPGSKDLIYKIVDDYISHGGKPFELAPSPAAADPRPAASGAPPAVADPRPPAPGAPPAGADLRPAASGAPPAGAGPRPAVPLAPMPGARSASSLPWNLELPPIQPLPGVPAITPRSPLESLGTGAASDATDGAGVEALGDPAAGEPAAGGVLHGDLPSGHLLSTGDLPAWAGDPSRAGGGTAAAPGPGGPPADPFAQMAAALPPLEELAPDVPALAPEPLPAPVEAASSPAAAPPAPTFSAFAVHAPRRRSRMPLVGVVVAILLLGLAAYLLRDTVLTWLENREEEAAQAAHPGGRPEAAPSAGAAARGAVAAVPGAASAASAASGGAPAPAAPGGAPALASPAGGAGTASGGSAGSAAASGGSAAPAGGLASTKGARGMPGSPPASSGTTAGPTGVAGLPGAATGRPVLEPVATGGAEHGAAAGSAVDTPSGLSAARVTTIEKITWQPTRDGTEVILWGNGDFPGQSYTRVRIGGIPVREVVRITGIDRPYPAARLEVRSPELVQIRTGYHPPRDLHVVLDLAGRDVQVTDIEPGPRQLHIHLRAK